MEMAPPRKPDSERKSATGVSLTQKQRATFLAMGASPWLQGLLDMGVKQLKRLEVRPPAEPKDHSLYLKVDDPAFRDAQEEYNRRVSRQLARTETKTRRTA
jgi:hypothetical protein